MSGVDNKVVSIKFDNAGFQQKVAETMASLDQLNAKLAAPAATSGLGGIKGALEGISFGPLSGAIDGISAKFIAMSTIAITALSNIVNRAVDAGVNLAKSLSLTPITQGFAEYELKMGSIQTIMAGSGESLDVVNGKLNELNEYSDRTIYSFKDMTTNIGKFTNAGVSLDESVASIQGVANVAALSGANSEEASRAMYNFAQAISTGSVKLMDWKSIELANMGTVEFKQQLIDSAEAAGTLTKAGDGLWKTLEGTEVTTKNFNTTLADGWLTSEALTTTLGRYSDATTDIGKRATAAATEVKTFSMMMDTIKEGVGSGWAMSSEHIFGNFEEAKELWTGLNDVIGGAISKSAQARNDMLAGWKNMGGRDVMLDSLGKMFGAIGEVLKPIQEAFRELFPRTTAGDLVLLTGKFAAFADKLRVSGETAAKIKAAFTGFFSIFKIGFEIIKGVFGVFGDIIGAFKGAGGGALDFAANLGNLLSNLRETLVEGGAIARFFENVGTYAAAAVTHISNFVAKIVEFVSSFKAFQPDAVSNGVKRVGERLSILGTIAAGAGKVWDFLVEAFNRVKKALEPLSDLFGKFKDTVSNLFKPADFDKSLDLVNTGLLGGIALLIKKFVDNGFKLDFGDGIFEKIGGAFEQLTGTLEAMQMKLKAEALMKIAIAIGVLTASVLVLSLIDSASLTKAMTALAVGFGQLVGVMALMDKMTDTKAGPKLATLAGAMMLLSGAVLILSFAIRNLSGLSWSELAKGLAGVAASMLIFAGAAKLLEGNTKGLIRAGIAMGIMSVGLLLMSVAVKAFAGMDFDTMGRGFIGIGIALLLLTGAMNTMPTSGMVKAAAGMLIMSAALIVMAEAVKSFAEMDFDTMARGMIGIGGALLLLVGAMQAMPEKKMLASSLAMVAMGGALLVMAEAVKSFAKMDFDTMARGFIGVGVALLMIVAATHGMTNALPGALAMVVVSGALYILAEVIKELSKLSIGELAIALGAIAGVFLILGLAAMLLSPVVPALMGLGIALGLIGGAFALFGLGASLVAKAFETMARAGKKGVEVLIDIIEALIAALPGFVETLAQALIDMAMTFLDAAPEFVDGLGDLISKLLEKIIELTPQFAEAFKTMLQAAVLVIGEMAPQFITLGLNLLINFLQGIRDNIYQIVTLAVEILTGFMQALTDNMPMIVNAAVNLIIAFAAALTSRSADLVTAGVNLLVSLIQGITQEISKIVTAVADLIVAFLGALTTELPRIITAGADLLIAFIQGIASNLLRIVAAAIEIITTFITELGKGASRIVTAGADALGDFIEGLGRDIGNLLFIGAAFIAELIEGIGSAAQTIIDEGVDTLEDFITGLSKNLTDLIDTGVEAIDNFIDGIVEGSLKLANEAAKALVAFLDGLTLAIETHGPEIRRAGRDLAIAVADGFTGGLAGKAADMVSAVTGGIGGAISAGAQALGIGGPSKVFMGFGAGSAEGYAIGLNKSSVMERAASEKIRSVAEIFNAGLNAIPNSLEGFDDIMPVITPVLDLSKVENEAKRLASLVAVAPIMPEASLERARHISTTADMHREAEAVAASVESKEITFVQNNYSPSELSTGDIYRNTKSQIALAKEELDI